MSDTSYCLCLQIELSVEDIETILNTLIYDAKVEHTVDTAKQRSLYRAILSPINSISMARTPCGVCPVSCGKIK